MGEPRRAKVRLDERRAFGARLRELREARGMTQEDLADAAGLARPVIGYIERAERDFGVSHLFDLANALGVPVSDLFGKH